MTRKEQNATILGAIGDQLTDMANVQDTIGKIYSDWFQGLVQQGAQLMQSSAPAPAETPQGGAAPAPAAA